MNARSEARFFAMLANRCDLNGVRLLSSERIRSFSTPRTNANEIDQVLARAVNLGIGGFHLGGESPPAPSSHRPQSAHHQPSGRRRIDRLGGSGRAPGSRCICYNLDVRCAEAGRESAPNDRRRRGQSLRLGLSRENPPGSS